MSLPHVMLWTVTFISALVECGRVVLPSSSKTFMDSLETCSQRHTRLPKDCLEIKTYFRDNNQNTSGSTFWTGRVKILSDWIVNLGCYNSPTRPAINQTVTGQDPVGECYVKCSRQFHFGLMGNTCFCLQDSAISSTLKANEILCNRTCGENIYQEICGGINQTTIYKTVAFRVTSYDVGKLEGQSKNITISSPNMPILMKNDSRNESCLLLWCSDKNKLTIRPLAKCITTYTAKGICDNGEPLHNQRTLVQLQQICRSKNSLLRWDYSTLRASCVDTFEEFYLNIYRRFIYSYADIDFSQLNIMAVTTCKAGNTGASMNCNEQPLIEANATEATMLCFEDDDQTGETTIQKKVDTSATLTKASSEEVSTHIHHTVSVTSDEHVKQHTTEKTNFVTGGVSENLVSGGLLFVAIFVPIGVLLIAGIAVITCILLKKRQKPNSYVQQAPDECSNTSGCKENLIRTNSDNSIDAASSTSTNATLKRSEGRGISEKSSIGSERNTYNLDKSSGKTDKSSIGSEIKTEIISLNEGKENSSHHEDQSPPSSLEGKDVESVGSKTDVKKDGHTDEETAVKQTMDLVIENETSLVRSKFPNGKKGPSGGEEEHKTDLKNGILPRIGNTDKPIEHNKDRPNDTKQPRRSKRDVGAANKISITRQTDLTDTRKKNKKTQTKWRKRRRKRIVRKAFYCFTFQCCMLENVTSTSSMRRPVSSYPVIIGRSKPK